MVKVEHTVLKEGNQEIAAFKFEGQTSEDTETLDFLSELFSITPGVKQGFTKYNRLIVQVKVEPTPETDKVQPANQ